MVISRRYLANADVIATAQMSENADVILGENIMYSALYALSLGKKIYLLEKLVFAVCFHLSNNRHSLALIDILLWLSLVKIYNF